MGQVIPMIVSDVSTMSYILFTYVKAGISG